MVFLLPIASNKYIKNVGPMIPPNDKDPSSMDTWNVAIGSARGFISVLFDFSFHIIGDVHTTLLPTPNTSKEAEKMVNVYF